MILAAAITCFINCTEVAKAPADPVTLQCFADKAYALEVNHKQADLIADLLAKVNALETQPAPKPAASKPQRICNPGRVLKRGRCVKGKK